MKKEEIYIDDRPIKIPEEYEKMSYKELEQLCKKMKNKTLKEIKKSKRTNKKIITNKM